MVGRLDTHQKRSLSLQEKTHTSAIEFSQHVDQYIGTELHVHHESIASPFLTSPLDNDLVLYPLHTVPQKGLDSEERRVVFDLSFPSGHSVNDEIPKESYLNVDQY